MRRFIEEHEQEVLLILVTMLGVTRWWMPTPTGFENMYGVSHWALSYDYGLVRRGLLGAIAKLWVPIMTLESVHLITLISYCTFLALLLVIFYVLLRHKDKGGRLFRLILLFVAAPATLSLSARDLGRFDLFLMMILLLSLTLVSRNRQLWLIPILMSVAMFIHEGFLVLCAPTIVAMMVFAYLREGRRRAMLVTIIASVLGVAGAFLVLYNFGTPALSFEEFSRLIQSRAAYHLTELSMRECYFSVRNHSALASSSLYDSGSIVNFIMAIVMMSPVFLVLANLWGRALKNCGAHRGAFWLLILATLSGLLLVPIATDYGRWLSAVVFCNFFAIFYLVSKDLIKVEELEEYAGGPFSALFVLILLTYLLFGPLHDWEPYPYKDNILVSSLSMMAVLLFDIGFCVRWRSLRRKIASAQ